MLPIALGPGPRLARSFAPLHSLTSPRAHGHPALSFQTKPAIHIVRSPPSRRLLRTVLSYYVTNGMMCALGMLLVSSLVHLVFGPDAAGVATVGIISTIAADLPAPRRGKFLRMLPATLIGVPLFFGMEMLKANPWHQGLLLVPATFVAFLASAWGKRGLPLAIAIMFSMIFSMSLPPPLDMLQVLLRTRDFALGAGGYLVFGVLANLALNWRYRVQFMADLLLSLASLMRAQAMLFEPVDETLDVRAVKRSLRAELLGRQAALADQLQSTRDIVLESPRTPRRQRLAHMLLLVLDVRDHLMASELDVDTLRRHAGHDAVMAEVLKGLRQLAGDLEQLADHLLLARRPPPPGPLSCSLAGLQIPWAPSDKARGGNTELSPTALARGMAHRVGLIDRDVRKMFALARREREPNVTVIRHHWQLFVSPTDWSWSPFVAVWRRNAPTLRHAIRASLAIATGFVISMLLPWASHAYWILLTIVLVMRGSLAQTIERRNHRVAGTLLGCALAMGLLMAGPSPAVLVALVTLTQGVAHAFAVRRYLITAVAATVLGLLQAHIIQGGSDTTLNLIERLADTLIGAGVAWAYSYVLPSWERGQIASLVRRSLKAQAEHARLALGLDELRSGNSEPELRWRLARREAYDSLSALVQATQRSLAEPRAVRPPLTLLEQLQSQSYVLLAQLTGVKSVLVARRDRLKFDEIEGPLQQALVRIETAIGQPPPEARSPAGFASAALPAMPSHATAQLDAAVPDQAHMERPDAAEHDRRSDASPRATDDAGDDLSSTRAPDPFDNDIGGWLNRRVDYAGTVAEQMRDTAVRVLARIPHG